MKHLNSLLGTALFLALFSAPKADTAELRPKIGLALSGGGAKGLAHIGVLKVIEEKHIPIDYITGTSMGAIIGGLYAVGYDAEQLEDLARNIDWRDLFTDEVSRRNLSMPEKEESARYIGSLPIFDEGISLPSGLIYGQKLIALLNRLTWPVHGTEDFRRFPIPFGCVATDIVTGEAVFLDHGQLSTAMRASMAIPTAFTPVELDGRLLVDGGIVRNFPVSEAIEMGADIIIGVDINMSQPNPEHLKSIAQIMNQAITLTNRMTIEDQRKQCDILIKPDMDAYTLLSFNAVDSLIALGEAAARAVSEQLDRLADSLGTDRLRTRSQISIQDEHAITITGVQVSGLKHVNRAVVDGRLMVKLPARLTAKQIDEAIEKVYGSGFFEWISYRIDKDQLILDVSERSIDKLQIGWHHDSEHDATLLLNATFRNKMGRGSRQLAEVRLGNLQGFRIAHFFDIGWNPGITSGITFKMQEWEMPLYQDERLMARYDMRYYELDGRFEGLISNTLSIGAGGFWRWSSQNPVWLPVNQDLRNTTYDYGGVFGFIKIDNLDRPVYPLHGRRIWIEYRNIPESINHDADLWQSASSFQHILPFSGKLALVTHGHLCIVDGSNIPEEQIFRTGGLQGPGLNFVPFPGFKSMMRQGKSVLALRAGLRWEIKNPVFITVEAGNLSLGSSVDDLLKENSSEYCWQFSVGILTPFGPLEWLVSGREDVSGEISWFSFGYTI